MTYFFLLKQEDVCTRRKNDLHKFLFFFSWISNLILIWLFCHMFLSYEERKEYLSDSTCYLKFNTQVFWNFSIRYLYTSFFLMIMNLIFFLILQKQCSECKSHFCGTCVTREAPTGRRGQSSLNSRTCKRCKILLSSPPIRSHLMDLRVKVGTCTICKETSVSNEVFTKKTRQIIHSLFYKGQSIRDNLGN